MLAHGPTATRWAWVGVQYRRDPAARWPRSSWIGAPDEPWTQGQSRRPWAPETILAVSNAIIVSYDGTPNDDDALALGRALAKGGSPLALAYVRHSREFDTRREELAEHDAQRRLEQGAAWLGEPALHRHVVVSPSTWEGLARLAAEESASMIVFGSDYRTPPGTVEPGTSAQHLLEGGPVAVAVAPAGIRTMPEAALSKIAVVEANSGGDAAQSAQVLASRLGGEVVPDGEGVDLLVVGSGAGAASGRVGLSGTARNRLGRARCAVLVVPAGAPLAL